MGGFTPAPKDMLVRLKGDPIVERDLGTTPSTGGFAYDGQYFYLKGGALTIYVYNTSGTLIRTLALARAYEDIDYDPFSDSLLAVGSLYTGIDILNKDTGALIETLDYGAYLAGTQFTSVAVDRYYNRIYLTRSTPPRIYVLSADAFLFVKFINNPFRSTHTALIPATMITALDGEDRSKIWSMYKSFPPLMGRIDGSGDGNKIDAYRIFGTTFDQAKTAINIRYANNLNNWYYWGNMESTMARLYRLSGMPLPTVPFVMPAAPSFDQDIYRWFNDDSAENPTPKATENTMITNIFNGDVLRLRLGFEEIVGSVLPWSGRVVLQYSSDGVTWTDVGGQTDVKPWRYYDGMGTSGNLVANLLLSNTTLKQYFVESPPSVSCLAYRSPDRGEFDFCFEAFDVLGSQDYYFRARTYDGRIETFTELPHLRTSDVEIFYPTADSHVYQLMSTSNYGDREYVWVEAGSGANRRARGLIIFDLSSIAPGTPITNATLRYYYYDMSGTDPVGRTHNFHRVTASWEELKVTWNIQPAHDAAVVGSYIVPASYGWIETDVTTQVQNWINGVHTNYGFKIVDANEGTGPTYCRLIFRSREYATLRPNLFVVY